MNIIKRYAAVLSFLLSQSKEEERHIAVTFVCQFLCLYVHNLKYASGSCFYLKQDMLLAKSSSHLPLWPSG